jgi:hypothetical protein
MKLSKPSQTLFVIKIFESGKNFVDLTAISLDLLIRSFEF